MLSGSTPTWQLKQAVCILLECILVFKIVFYLFHLEEIDLDLEQPRVIWCRGSFVTFLNVKYLIAFVLIPIISYSIDVSIKPMNKKRPSFFMFADKFEIGYLPQIHI